MRIEGKNLMRMTIEGNCREMAIDGRICCRNDNIGRETEAKGQ